jgi:hypothetical protein
MMGEANQHADGLRFGIGPLRSNEDTPASAKPHDIHAAFYCAGSKRQIQRRIHYNTISLLDC